jgi:hypothetical protein
MLSFVLCLSTIILLYREISLHQLFGYSSTSHSREAGYVRDSLLSSGFRIIVSLRTLQNRLFWCHYDWEIKVYFDIFQSIEATMHVIIYPENSYHSNLQWYSSFLFILQSKLIVNLPVVYTISYWWTLELSPAFTHIW